MRCAPPKTRNEEGERERERAEVQWAKLEFSNGLNDADDEAVVFSCLPTPFSLDWKRERERERERGERERGRENSACSSESRGKRSTKRI